MTLLAEPLFIQIGRTRYQVQSLAQASAMYCAARDTHGEGASCTPEALIMTADGRKIGHISYNGRVWPPQDWQPGMTPLYDNAAT
jgi:hypothetical protein